MTRNEYTNLRRIGRTFLSYANQVNVAGGLESSLFDHMLRWFASEYEPVKDMASDIWHATRPGAGAFHTGALKHWREHGYDGYEEQKRLRLSQARMARYFRHPLPLTA